MELHITISAEELDVLLSALKVRRDFLYKTAAALPPSKAKYEFAESAKRCKELRIKIRDKIASSQE
jgi:hypothetical protein